MACNCAKERTRTFIQSNPELPAVIIGSASVTMGGVCFEQQIKRGADKDDQQFVALAARASATGYALCVAGDEAVEVAEKACFNKVVVTLDKSSTKGWRIDQVEIAADTFAVKIPAGGTREFVFPCDEECGSARGRVRIVDAKGKFVASLGGFKICACD